MTHQEDFAPRILLPWPIVLFLGWVLMRYCVDPVLPNATGFGENVTGFRPYLNYGIDLFLILFLCAVLRRREDFLLLIHWLVFFSFFFIVLLTPLIFTKSVAVANFLTRSGMFVTVFDNGWLRFVSLPFFGCVLLAVALFPNLYFIRRFSRNAAVIVGIMVIVMGGNRSSFLIAILLFLVTALVRRRLVAFGLVALAFVGCLALFRYLGENVEFERGVGFLRIMSLVSQRVAQETGADANFDWRIVRWERAIQDVRKKPMLGWGYGGLENAFVFRDYAEFAAAAVDWDVASGTIHNGFISGARALGIPGLILFIIAFSHQLNLTGKRLMQLRGVEPILGDFYGFAFVNLAALTIAISTGVDLNSPTLWFFLILGEVIQRIQKSESRLESAANQVDGVVGLAVSPAG
jgi:O-antigen ligase